MKLQYLLISTIIGITSLNSQTNADNLQAYNPVANLIPISQPQEPKKEDNYQYMKAIIQKEDNFSDEIEIKYKK